MPMLTNDHPLVRLGAQITYDRLVAERDQVTAAIATLDRDAAGLTIAVLGTANQGGRPVYLGIDAHGQQRVAPLSDVQLLSTPGTLLGRLKERTNTPSPRVFSLATRRKMARAQKRRWAAIRRARAEA
jgi:hypothetical protein